MSGPFLRNPYLLFLTIALIVVAGVSAFIALPRLEDPRIVQRFPVVLAPFPGASAERVESLLTEPLETALDEIPEIKLVESTSRRGFATLRIELADAITEDQNDEVFSRIRSKLDEVAADLPPGARAPTLDEQRIPAAFTLIAGLVWHGEGAPPMAILGRLAEDLADRLRRIPGTELVRTYGGPEEEITVLADPLELERLGLSAADLASRAAAADAKRPAGVLRQGDASLLLEVAGELDTVERIRSVPITGQDGGSILRLGQIATVERGVREPPGEIALSDGRRAVLVAARMSPDVRIGDWAGGARAVLAELEREVGGGVELATVFDQALYTNARLAELGGNLLLGAAVILIVVFLTMGWRLSLLVGAALPLTALAVLFCILVLGGQLHQMSIFGMIIALGLLIDNAIVVVDEIRKRREAGLAIAAAVAETSRHLVWPLFASTLTTVLAFAPIVLLSGGAGDFVGYIGVSVILAVSLSFLISLTVIAALAGRYGRFHNAAAAAHRSWWRHGLPGARLARVFRVALGAGLRHPFRAMAVAAALPLLGFGLAGRLGSEFFPPVDRDMFDIQLWLPTDASIGRTLEQVRAVEGVIRDDPAVRHVHWLVGASFPSVYYNIVMGQDSSPHYARGTIAVASAGDTARLVPLLQARLDESFPRAQVVVRSFGQGPPIQAGVQYRLFGPSIERLQELGEEVRLALQSHPEVLHAQVSMPRGEPKLWFDADEVEAERADLTLLDLARQLDGGLEGAVGGSVLEDLEQLPVRVRLEGRRSRISSLGSMRFTTPEGSIPLESMGRITLRPELGGITRYDGERVNIVSGHTAEGALPIDVGDEVLARLEESGFAMPAGYRLEQGGAAEEDSDAVGNLLTYAPMLFTLMLASIILVFRSLRIALVLVVVAVLCVGLALLSTWTIGFPVSFNTILGTLGLIGVGLNDSIVVLASIRANERARRGDHAAILDEVLGCTRHVVATTLTTVGGFLPLLVLIGGSFWPSLAIVLVGGVLGATILALVFVPAAFVLLHRRGRVVAAGLGRRAEAAA